MKGRLTVRLRDFPFPMSLEEAVILKGAAGYGCDPSDSEMMILEQLLERIEAAEESWRKANFGEP